MKNLNFHKLGVFIILAILMSFYSVKAMSIAKPIPEKESLSRGESTSFYFVIDNTGNPSGLSCSYSASGLDPLVIKFNEEKTELKTQETKAVYGTVSVPTDAPLKSYGGTFSVQCQPLESTGEGSSVVQTATLFFPTLNVVEKVATPTTIPEKAAAISYSSIFIVLIILVIVIGIVYRFKKEKMKK
jgi:hypothetical protein